MNKISSLDALLIQLVQRLFDLLAGVAAAHIHGERYPLELVIACLGERRDAGQKLCRNIVDTKKSRYPPVRSSQPIFPHRKAR